jgi:tRNA(adenine34) deaminase
MNDEYWMQQALILARQAADEGEVPVGALLINKNQQLIAKAHNKTIQHIDPTAHAEILVLRQAALIENNYRLPGTTLYCTLEPCAMCAGAIIQARLDRVVFAAYDAKSGAVCSVLQLLNHASLNHQADAVGSILADQSIALMQDFFRSKRQSSRARAQDKGGCIGKISALKSQ